MKVFEAVAHALQEEGVRQVFGLMGDGNLRFLTYWGTELGQPYYGARHESAAVAMADGYARVSGEVAVCTVTQGPGLTNTLTALVTARKARTPLVLLVGDVASFQTGWPQDIDQEAVFAAAEVPVVTLRDPATAFSDVIAAVRLARRRRGPVGIDMPIDVQELEWNAWSDDTENAAEPEDDPTVDAELVARAADLLLAGKRPVVIGGRGAVESGCAQSLVAIGDRLGALFATALRGKGLFGEHPYSVGVAGGIGSNLSAQLIGEADTVLVVGAGLNDFTMMRGSLLHPRATMVRVDIDPQRAGETTAGHVGIVGDAAAVTRALEEELRRREVQRDGFRPRARASLEGFRADSEFRPVEEPGAIDPRSLVIRLDDLLPDDRLVVLDSGHFFGYPVAYLGVPEGRAFVSGIDFGSIGLGIGMAVGAALARPDLRPVLFIGDGGLMMSLGDLDTVLRYEIPLLIVVMNDAAYGSELQILRFWGLDDRLSTFPETDFAALARTLGLHGVSVDSLDQLDVLKDVMGADGRITLLDCRISRTVRAAWLEEAFRH